MTELPDFIDVYTYEVDPDYDEGQPLSPIAEYINGEYVRTNFDENPSFDHQDPTSWTPPLYSHISEDWSVTGNTSLYVEPSEGFGFRQWGYDPFGF